MKIKLGTIEIDRELWARCKAHGYSRNDVRNVIVGNGEESLIDALDTTCYCSKCGIAATQGSHSETCEHEWVQK